MVFDINKYPKYIIEDRDIDESGFITDEPGDEYGHIITQSLRPEDEYLEMAYWVDCSIKTYKPVMSSEDIQHGLSREYISIYPKLLFNKKPWLTLSNIWINFKSKVTCSVLLTGPFGAYKKYYEVYKWRDMGHPCIIYSHKDYDLSRKFYNTYVTKEWVIKFCHSNKKAALQATREHQEKIKNRNQKPVNKSAFPPDQDNLSPGKGETPYSGDWRGK